MVINEPADMIQVWSAVGPSERNCIASARWREWPRSEGASQVNLFIDRATATTMTRESVVPAESIGYLLRVSISVGFLKKFVNNSRAGESPSYTIPISALDEFNAAIVGAIVEVAEYRIAVPNEEFVRAADFLGAPLSASWQAYLQCPSWFRRGLLPNERFIELYPPAMTIELLDAWEEAVVDHPGIVIIGGNGSREMLVLNHNREPSPVFLVDITSEGWDCAIRQTRTVDQLIRQIELGDFDLTFAI